MKTPSPDDPLDPLLDRWNAMPEPPSRLTAEVWQRIATERDAPMNSGNLWAALGAWLERPVFAIGFVAACAVIGLFLAEVRISHAQRERNAQLAQSYLQLIDPLLTVAKTEDPS